MSHRLSLALLFAAALCSPLSADLIFSTDFTSESNGELRNDASWYGQAAWTVDNTGSGSASTVSGSFARVANSNGALATVGEPSFVAGDRLTHTSTLSFSLANATNTFDIYRAGVTSIAAGGGTPNIEMGFKLQYNQFRAGGTGPGSLKLYGNFGDTDNSVALIVDADQFGMDPFGTSGATDLDSDNLTIAWEVLKTATADEWVLASMSMASGGNTFTYSGGPVTFNYSGAEAFAAIQGTNNGNATSLSLDSISYDAVLAVPEPSTAFMFAAGLFTFVRRRRS